MTTTTHGITYAIRMLAREAENLTRTALEPLGVTPIQYDAMEAIYRYMNEPDRRALMPSRIGRIIQIKRSSSSDNVIELKKKGYVRIANGGSRLLTATGLELLKDCRTALLPANGKLIQYFAIPHYHGPAALNGALARQQQEADI